MPLGEFISRVPVSRRRAIGIGLGVTGGAVSTACSGIVDSIFPSPTPMPTVTPRPTQAPALNDYDNYLLDPSKVVEVCQGTPNPEKIKVGDATDRQRDKNNNIISQDLLPRTRGAGYNPHDPREKEGTTLVAFANAFQRAHCPTAAPITKLP